MATTAAGAGRRPDEASDRRGTRNEPLRARSQPISPRQCTGLADSISQPSSGRGLRRCRRRQVATTLSAYGARWWSGGGCGMVAGRLSDALARDHRIGGGTSTQRWRKQRHAAPRRTVGAQTNCSQPALFTRADGSWCTGRWAAVARTVRIASTHEQMSASFEPDADLGHGHVEPAASMWI
jgi:hypothetical protein